MKHGYVDVVDVAVSHAMAMPLEQAYLKLTPAMYISWVRGSDSFLSGC